MPGQTVDERLSVVVSVLRRQISRRSIGTKLVKKCLKYVNYVTLILILRADHVDHVDHVAMKNGHQNDLDFALLELNLCQQKSMCCAV